MGKLLLFIGSIIARIFTDKVVSAIAWKVILTGLFVIILPIILNNFLYDIMEIATNYANQSGSSTTFSGAMTFTGFLAWLVDCFQLAQCLSLYVGALLLRLALNMIPFVRL